MTEQDFRHDSEPRAGFGPRHRRSASRGVSALRATVLRLRQANRGLVFGGAAMFLLLALLIGYAAVASRDPRDDPAAQATPGQATPGQTTPGQTTPGQATPADPNNGRPGSSAPTDSAIPSVPAGTPAPGGRSGTPSREGADRPPTRSATPTPSAPRRKPRLVGPANGDDFDNLLDAHCRRRGDREAELLEGPERSRATGTWACVRVEDYTPVNIGDACREKFGENAQARKTRRDDSRTWRCFDS